MVGAKRRLGDLLTLDIDVVEVDEYATYDLAGVYSFGRGLFCRGKMEGSSTAYSRLHRLKRSQLVVSKLKAFEGALAVVPTEFEGKVLSPEFPTFSCVAGDLDAEYLAHLCCWPELWKMLRSSSKGIGARRERVNPSQLLELELRIPSLERQRRVAAHLDRVKALQTEITQKADRAQYLKTAYTVSAATRPDMSFNQKESAGWRQIILDDIVTPVSDVVTLDSSTEYAFCGVYSFGRGLIDRGVVLGSETSYKTATRLSQGDIVMSKLNGWEGAIAVVPERFDGHTVSPEYPTFRPTDSRAVPEFLDYVIRAPSFWTELDKHAKGSMVRRRRISSSNFLSAKIWLPPLTIQNEVVAHYRHMHSAGSKQGRAGVIAEALFPAALNEAFADLT